MGTPLRLLVVEDSQDDYDLLLLELERGNYELDCLRVESATAMRTALTQKPWDLVISDFVLPAFSAMAALEVLSETGLDVPFLIVSGTISEDIAVEALRAGAHDFMPKTRLARLLPAIERELREARHRAGQRAAEEERRQAEAQLLVADRMVSVGTLAAGVAHEINNPLAALIANLELAIGDVASLATLPGAEATVAMLTEELDDARTAAERVRNIVRDLKVFSRGDQGKRGSVDVQRVLESTLRMARNEIRHRARLVTSFGKVPAVDASESRLGQVFLNLIVNAAQAIGEGRADANEIRIVTRAENGRVVVEIGDTGPGIPPEVMKRIFSPFVTTKPVGVGTGLGLSICHRLVTELGGEISVESSPGEGALFRISLPPSAPGSVEEVSAPAAPAAAAARRGKVLVIDDEPLIAKAVERTLGRDHDVASETHAQKALDRIVAGDRFDVILCDVMMPEMTGMDFYVELNRLVPEQVPAVVFLTGGAFTPRARDFLDETKSPRIDKPFDGAKLREAVTKRVR